MKKTICFVAFVAIISLSDVFAQAQWRGPERTGIYPDKQRLKVWPEAGPELVLDVEGVGDGFSSAVDTTTT